MTKNSQRQSQVVSTFGPGAMIDLPTRSVIVGGLELWDMRGLDDPISEPRVTARLEKLLKATGRLDEAKYLTLRKPPVPNDGVHNGLPRGIRAPVFPTWFVCERKEGAEADDKPTRRRRLVEWKHLETKGGFRTFVDDDGAKSAVTPIRFVAACKLGHLQDINWRWALHGPKQAREPCEEPMWVEEKGTSADPADTAVVCGCGARLSLTDLQAPGRLGECRGERPWLVDKEPNGCRDHKGQAQPLKLLIRTATNTYFPQVYTVISLPAEDDDLTKLVDAMASDLADVQSLQDLVTLRRLSSKVREALKGYTDEDVFARLQRIRDGALAQAGGPAKLAEVEVLASGQPRIGQNQPTSKLYAETLRREDWAASPEDAALAATIRNLVVVHRLREVSCLYGFTRFEAAPTSADGELDDVGLAVEGAPIARDTDWLPAIEQLGEGLFIHFDEQAIAAWLAQETTQKRHEKLVAGYGHWAAQYQSRAPDYPGTAYVLLHSLSHALITEIALDCGYPASSLKERVYALGSDRGAGAPDQCGVLVYTASAGAQGTLGGLVATAPRFLRILRNALERAQICSNDPICADHAPDERGDRATHGAACHGCLLVAETSCEMRNLFLDRNLLTTTMATDRAPFFPEPS